MSSLHAHGRGVSAVALLLNVVSAGRECFIKDVGYPADITSNKGANSPMECQDNCAENLECEFWTYNPSNNFCFLNKGNRGPSGFEATPSTFGFVSGPKQGCHGGECFQKDVRYPPQITTDRGASSPEECQQNCAAHSECMFWTYNPSNNFCFLNKGGVNGFESSQATVGLVSGPKMGCHEGTLRAAAAKTGILLGAAMNDFALASDTESTAVHAKEFDLITGENGCKWEKVEPQQQGVYDFTLCDAQYNHALRHGQRFRGHTMGWGLQNPRWLVNGGFSPEEKARILVNHVKVMITRYPKADSWDVVNEALSDTRDGLKENFWYPDVPNYVELAFQAAREANPNMKLFYNEYSVLSATGFAARKSRDMFNLAKRLKEKNLLDGVGIQCHVPMLFNNYNGMRENMQRYADIGIEVHITELDLACRGFGAPDGGQSQIIPCPAWGAAEKEIQAIAYNNMARVCIEEPACTGFETWGFTDRYSWLGTEQHPLLWDEVLNKKPAYFGVINAFQNARDAGCFLRDVQYPPQIASDRGAISPQDCQEKCAETSECQFWTYNPSNNFCFLNKGTDGASGFESNPSTVGLVSGPKQGCHVSRSRRRLVDRLLR